MICHFCVIIIMNRKHLLYMLTQIISVSSSSCEGFAGQNRRWTPQNFLRSKMRSMKVGLDMYMEFLDQVRFLCLTSRNNPASPQHSLFVDFQHRLQKLITFKHPYVHTFKHLYLYSAHTCTHTYTHRYMYTF